MASPSRSRMSLLVSKRLTMSNLTFVDHSFFYTATQDFKLHLYSTQDAPLSRLANNAGRNALLARPQRRSIYARHYDDDGPDDHSLRKIKTVQGVHGQWTVTDADLSRDNEW
jgi:WD repeat-containing protein 23